MATRQKPRKSLYILGAALLLLLLIFLFGGDGLWDALWLKRDVDQIQARVDSLNILNDKMEKRVEGLESGDLKTLEEEARQFNMVKEGEKVYIMAPEKDKTKPDKKKNDK